MSAMHSVFVEFVGAGLTALHDDGPAGALPRSGTERVRQLAACGSRDRVVALIERVVRQVWQEWAHSGRPKTDLESHLALLPALLAIYRPKPSSVQAASSDAARSPRRGGSSVELLAHRLASETVSQARAAGAFDDRRLDETLSFFLLTRLFAALLAHTDVVAPRQSEMASAPCASSAVVAADADPGHSPAIEATVARVVEAFGMPRAAALAALKSRAETAAADRSDAVRAAELEDTAARYTGFCRELAALGDGLADVPAAAPLVADAAAGLAAGDARAACQALAEIEELLAQAPATAFIAATEADTLPPPHQVRALRGTLATVAGDWRSAARHYAVAAKAARTAPRSERRALLLAGARALAEHGTRYGDEKALVEAAQIYAEAGGLVSEETDPIGWAEANLELGILLLTLGDLERRPERLLAAALHFRPAVAVFSRHHRAEEWAIAQLGLGRALMRQGEVQGDVVTLRDAAFSYRAALGVLTRASHPGEWAEAQLSLGRILVRIGEESGDVDAFTEAVPALKAALSDAEVAAAAGDIATARATLGRAYVGLAAGQRDDAMLQEAISLFESALAAGARGLVPRDAAALERVRGTALAELGERRGSLRLLEDAVRAKLAALDHYEAVADDIAAEQLRHELDGLADRIERIDGARTHDTGTHGAAVADTPAAAASAAPG